METQQPIETTGRDVPKYVPPEPDYMGLAGLLSAQGRVGRKTFWTVLVWTVLVYAGAMVAGILVFEQTLANADGGALVMWLALTLTFVWLVAADCVKRLHDADKNGWTALLLLIPLINIMVLIGLGVTPGTDGPNRYGPRAQRIRWWA
jgi:uncharacterized membrane protein YhaH (DUF805 family)